MKRLLTMLLSFCMILSIGAHTAAAAETTLLESENGVLLSSLDDEECREFLLNQGVSIPEELSGIDLPELFADLENNPDMIVSLGWTTLADFIEEVRTVVKLHYGMIKTDEPRTLDFSGVRGFLVTNVCIVQRSAA